MNLATRYLGLTLEHPIVASASPLTSTVDGIRALAAAGAAAVVMPSLFEEQIRAEDTAYAMYTEHGSFSQAEAGSYFPAMPEYDSGVAGHLDTLRRAVAAVDIPVIASLNAVTIEGWTNYATRLEQAGAAALELNMYFIPTDPAMSGEDVEARYVEAVHAVKRATKIPVAVKLPPYFSSTGHMARRLVDAGADGLVLFNRFYQPDFDLATLDRQVRADAELQLRSRAGAALDRHARRQGPRLARGDERRRIRRAGRQVPARRRRCRDDDLRVATPRPVLHDDPRHGTRRVARPERP